MFSSSSVSVSVVRRLAMVSGAIGVLAIGGQALANDNHGHGDRHDHDHARVSFGFGFSDYGSGFGLSVGDGRRGYRYGPGYYSYGRSYYYAPFGYPRSYYEPVYVPGPYYPAPVVVERYEPEPVVVERPVYATQTLAQAPVVVAPAPRPVVVERPAVVQRPAPAPQPAPERGGYQDRELGDAYLRMGDAQNAARVYGRYLNAWNGDGTVNRNYGFAQIQRGEVQDGFRAVARGYQLESNMVQRPLTVEELGGAAVFQRLLDSSVQAAAGNNSSEGWLTVVVLQHAAGQNESAMAALRKSGDAGLDKGTLDAFTLELGRSMPQQPAQAPH